MPKPWLKLWSALLENEKIQRLDGNQTKNWLLLLCVALRFDKRGMLPPISSIAFQIRRSLETTQQILNEMVTLKLVESSPKYYAIHDWEYWQGNAKSDAQRKREQRDKKRDKSRDIIRDNICDTSQPRSQPATREFVPKSRVEKIQENTRATPSLTQAAFPRGYARTREETAADLSAYVYERSELNGEPPVPADDRTQDLKRAAIEKLKSHRDVRRESESQPG
jgi:hypothetical protein